LVAAAGLVYLMLRARSPAMAILAAGIAVQIYTISALLGRNVFLGASFGFRLLTETCVLMVPGIAILLDRLGPRMCRRVVTVGAILVAWNLRLLGVYRHGVGGAEGGGPTTVLAMVGLYLDHRPLEAIELCVLGTWIAYVLVAVFRAQESDVTAETSEAI